MRETCASVFLMDKKDAILKELNQSKFDRARAAKFDINRASGSLASRSIPTRVSNIDAEARTAEFSFASNKPIEHWFGYLILDTKPDAVILDRVLQGVCSHLVNHDPDKQVGVVLSDSINLGDMVRGTSKFSRSVFGNEIFQDVVDEIRNGISFGFLVHEMVMESETDGIPTYRATKWEILEVSTVSIPADISVGIGRDLYLNSGEEETEQSPQENLENLENSDTPESGDISNKKETLMEEEEIVVPPAVADEVPASTPALDLARELIAFGAILGNEKLAREYAEDGKTLAEFRTALKAKRSESTPIPPKQTENLVERTIARMPLQAFKGERGAENARRFGEFLNAVLFKSERSKAFCRSNGIPLTRAQSESDNESGGIFVPTEFENVLIDLRLQYGVFRRNANVVPMSTDSKTRPRRRGGLKAYPIGAVGAARRLKESKMFWDAINLLAKKWGVLAKYEEELAEDAVISMADTLASEIAYAFTEVEDECGFYGDGSGDYHGIVGVIPKLLSLNSDPTKIAGLQVASGNSWTEITLADILAVVGRLPSFARSSGNVKWYCTNEFWATVLCKIALQAGGATTAQIQGETQPMFLGKPVEIVEAMPHVEDNSQVALLYGNLAQAAMFGDRRGVTIKMTDSNDTDFEEDLMAIKGTERFDINVHDVGNADNDPKKRLAGPIVGLMTAAA